MAGAAKRTRERRQPYVPEDTFRKLALRLLKRSGVAFKHYRNHMGPGIKRGRPDDVFLFADGVALWIEFKSPGKEPTSLQAREIRQLKELSHLVYVCDSDDSTRHALTQALGIYDWTGASREFPDAGEQRTARGGPRRRKNRNSFICPCGAASAVECQTPRARHCAFEGMPVGVAARGDEMERVSAPEIRTATRSEEGVLVRLRRGRVLDQS